MLYALYYEILRRIKIIAQIVQFCYSYGQTPRTLSIRSRLDNRLKRSIVLRRFDYSFVISGFRYTIAFCIYARLDITVISRKQAIVWFVERMPFIQSDIVILRRNIVFNFYRNLVSADAVEFYDIKTCRTPETFRIQFVQRVDRLWKL